MVGLSALRSHENLHNNPKMNPSTKDHFAAVLQAHHQFDGDYCAVSALEFVSKIYEQIAPDKFPLQADPQNQHKGFDEHTLQNLVLLGGCSTYYDIQSAVETIEKETNEGRCVLVSLRAFHTFDGIIFLVGGYHILVALSLEGQPILIDPQTKQVLARGKEDLAKVLQRNSDLNHDRKTIHMEILLKK